MRKRNKITAILFGSAVLATASSLQTQEIHQGYSETADQYEVDGNVISNVDIKAPLWNPRGKSPEQVQARADFLLESYDLVRTPEQQARADEAREKYSDAIAINSVMIGSDGVAGHAGEHFAKGLQRNFEAGMTLTSVTPMPIPRTAPPTWLSDWGPRDRSLANWTWYWPPAWRTSARPRKTASWR